MSALMNQSVQRRDDEERIEQMVFTNGDRVRHRRGWYGTVIEDNGGTDVRVRYDDGTVPVLLLRETLEPAERISIDVHAVIAQLRELRADIRLTSDEVVTVDQAIEALSRPLGERSLKLRIAAEVDRMTVEVMHDPFDREIASQPRVRQWYAAGARWALEKLQEHAAALRQQPTPEAVTR